MIQLAISARDLIPANKMLPKKMYLLKFRLNEYSSY